MFETEVYKEKSLSECKLQACYSSLIFLKENLDIPQVKKSETCWYLDQLVEFIAVVANNPDLIKKFEQKIVLLTAFLYDFFGIQNMKPKVVQHGAEVSSKSIFEAAYYRSYAYIKEQVLEDAITVAPEVSLKNFYCIPKQELPYVFQNLETRQSDEWLQWPLHKIASVEQFLAYPEENFAETTELAAGRSGIWSVIEEQIPLSKVALVKEKFIRLVKKLKTSESDDMIGLTCWVQIGDAAVGVLPLGQHSDSIQAVSPISMPDLLKAFLEDGRAIPNLLKDPQDITKSRIPEKDTGNADQSKTDWLTILNILPSLFTEKYQLIKARKLVSVLRQGDDTSWEALVESHQKHYQRMFNRWHPFFKQKVLLTRSGTSANEVAKEVAFLFAAQGTDEPPFLAIDHHSYYENMKVTGFQRSILDDELNVCFVSSDPTIPIKYGFDYETSKRDGINKIKERALIDQSHWYVAILDKTARPFDQSFLEDKNLPPNLIFIETISFSKHGRGEQNYNGGMVSIWGPEILKSKITDILNQNQATPYCVLNNCTAIFNKE